MKKIIIYGKGSFAKLMHYYFNNESRYEVIAFCVDDKFLDEKQFCGLPVVSLKNIEKIYSVDNYLIFVAVGYSNMRARKTMYNKVKSLGYSCPRTVDFPTHSYTVAQAAPRSSPAAGRCRGGCRVS